MAASYDKLLLNIDFPVFVIKSIGPKHFIIGGGGGPSSTGVPNGLDVVELSSDNEIGEISAKKLCRFNSDKYAIMNCGIMFDNLKRAHLACGHDDKCYVYVIKQKVVTPRPNSPDGQLRKRKSGLTQADDFKNAKKVVTFDVQLVDSLKTDFDKEDPYQNCAVFSSDGSKLVTAGADGHIRAWQYPELNKLWETKAHETEVEAIDMDPSATQICSTSKDRKLILWSVEDGSRLGELKWATEPSVKYKHKACKYTMIDKDPNKACLFTIEVPVVHKQGAPCYISQWNIRQYKPITVQPVHHGTLSCMEVSDCGAYITVGTMEGGVAVHDTSNFKCLYKVKNSHKTFVTGLAFSPSSYVAKMVTNGSKFTLVSISIDNQVKLHQPARRSWRSFKLVLLFLLICLWLFLTFLIPGIFSTVFG